MGARENQTLNGYLYRRAWITRVLGAVDFALGLFFRSGLSVAPSPPAPAKILLVKPDHLGDFLLSTGVLAFLRRQYPQARIDYLIGNWNADLAAAYPEIGRLHFVRHPMLQRQVSFGKKWARFLSDLRKALPAIRREEYDLILFLRPFGGNFVFLSRLFGAKRTAGHGTGGGGPLLDFKAPWAVGVHEREHYAEVLRAAGIAARGEDLHPFYPAENEPAAGGDYICLHPGAGDAAKQLTPAEWAHALAGEKRPVYLIGAPADGQWLKPLAAALGREPRDFTGRLNLPELHRLLGGAAAVHALDSFGAHFAATRRCPEVVVHFRPGSDEKQWRPVGGNVRIVRHGLKPEGEA